MNEYRDTGWLREKYLKEGLSCKAIGRLVERDAATIWRWLRRLEIPTRTRSEAMKKREKKRRQITEEERQERQREVLRLKKELATMEELIKEQVPIKKHQWRQGGKQEENRLK